MDDLIAGLQRLLDETPGGYVSKAKIQAMLDEPRTHEDHGTLWHGPSCYCSCGEIAGMATVMPPEDNPHALAHDAAAAAYAEVLRGDNRYHLNACLGAAVDAALATYGHRHG